MATSHAEAADRAQRRYRVGKVERIRQQQADAASYRRRWVNDRYAVSYGRPIGQAEADALFHSAMRYAPVPPEPQLVESREDYWARRAAGRLYSDTPTSWTQIWGDE